MKYIKAVNEAIKSGLVVPHFARSFAFDERGSLFFHSKPACDLIFEGGIWWTTGSFAGPFKIEGIECASERAYDISEISKEDESNLRLVVINDLLEEARIVCNSSFGASNITTVNIISTGDNVSVLSNKLISHPSDEEFQLVDVIEYIVCSKSSSVAAKLIGKLFDIIKA